MHLHRGSDDDVGGPITIVTRGCLLIFITIAASFWGGAAPASGEPLVLYTSQPNTEATATVAAFERAHPDVKVQLIRSGASDLLLRIQAEHRSRRPTADVALLADLLTMEALKADNLLAQYPSAKTGGVPKMFIDADHYYFGTKILATGIACRNDAPLQAAAWQDLLDPQLRGKIVMPSPVYSGSASIFVAAMKADHRFGLGYFDRLRANGLVLVNGNAEVLETLRRSPRMCGVILDYMALQAAAKGAPVLFSLPREGISAATQPVAVLAGAAHPDAAKLFVDFVLSEAGQRLARDQGFYPADPAVTALPDHPSLVDVHFMSVEPLAALYESTADNLAFAGLFQ